MSTIDLKPVEPAELEFQRRTVLDGGSSGTGSEKPPRISLGRSDPILLAPDRSGVDPALASYLREHPDFSFCLLSFTCNFWPDDHPILQADIALSLDTAEGPRSNEWPIVWSMTPERLSSPIKRTASVKLDSKVEIIPVTIGGSGQSGTEVTGDLTYLVATGKGEPTALWRFRKTLVVDLEGMHDLTLVIKTQTDTATTVELRVDAYVKNRLRYRAKMPSQLRRIELPKGSA